MSDKYQFGYIAGSADVSIAVGPIRKSADNSEYTGLAAGDVTAYYWRQGGSATAISLSALASITAAHSDGGWAEADATNLPGVYRLDLPDAVLATGADWVQVGIQDSAGSGLFWAEIYPLTSGAWALTPRTLTSTAASVTAAISGSDITVSRHVYWAASLTGLGAITGWDRLWFTLKARKSDADSAAIVQILLSAPGGGSDGLVYLEGAAAATPSDGGITVDDAGAGDITVWLLADATSLLSVRSGCYYDVKWRDSAGKVHQLTEANATIRDVVTRATS